MGNASTNFDMMSFDDFEELLADKPRNERWELIGGRLEAGATSVDDPGVLFAVLSLGTEARDRFEK